MSPRRTLLVVDDDSRLRPRLVRAFARRGLDAHGAESPAAALALVDDGLVPELAVVDLRMPGGSGLELIGALIERLPELRVVLLTGYGSIPAAVEAVHRGAVDVLAKPADADMILAALDRQPGAAPAEYAPPSLARAEWEHIQRVLSDCEGNISEAARRLGLHRRTLQRKLAKLPPAE
jgi:two-component system response regulator RegA